ncbi:MULTISPECIES: DUF3429 domain-containing protein [Thalassolituus]|jgi:hypothetical protein|uniref:DUF3429 domain-containing protein n=1 Tax=Thalassolituus TaxID=187492 RepID=UPI000C5E5DB7|nr:MULTISPECIES: DUF3429 domain-containing protein [Thalassolituus]MAY14830.1 hypothetical protein [Oceanospirillaceae bacterium]MCA6060877.1 DUF3429 domain-containing protein [Thalassolituus sp. ST750PaO-4]MCB2387966.1 DUF3429 domain-containing protein [Thalassolituus alkanivorans]MCB2422492.1 DUF3429 domain-containing protein [Thalassolituus alkanivorans]
MALSISEKLGYAGLLPFIAGATAVVLGIDGGEEFFKLYSLLILAFMAGGCWGVEQANPEQIDEIPLELSIGTFLWGLLAYFLPTNVAVLMFMVGFWLLLWTETNPIFKRAYAESYKRLRNILTAAVTILNVIVFIAVH